MTWLIYDPSMHTAEEAVEEARRRGVSGVMHFPPRGTGTDRSGWGEYTEPPREASPLSLAFAALSKDSGLSAQTRAVLDKVARDLGAAG